MKRPLVLLLDENKEELGKLAELLNVRLSSEARLVSVSAAADVLLRVKDAQQSPVALVIAAEEALGFKGHEVLAQVHNLNPFVTKLLLVRKPIIETLPRLVNQTVHSHMLVAPWEPGQLFSVVDTALQAYRKRSDLDTEAHLLNNVLTASGDLLAQSEPEAMLEHLLYNLVELTQCDRVIYIRKKDGHLEVGGVQALNSFTHSQIHQEWQANEAKFTEDVLSRFNETLEASAGKYPSRMVVPVSRKGETIGYMLLENPDTNHRFTPAQAHAVQLLSSLTALNHEFVTRILTAETKLQKGANATGGDEATIQELKALLHSKDLKINEGLHYALRIQESLTSDFKLTNYFFPESFVLIQPKEVVSGDFYWVAEKFGNFHIAAVDCTGHGVPGAFMSVIGTNHLNATIQEFLLKTPADILESLHGKVQTALSQHKEYADTNDGMDVGLCMIDTQDRLLQFAGAGRPAYIVRTNGELIELKGSPQSVGSQRLSTKSLKIENHHYFYQAGDMLYLFTDLQLSQT